MTDEPHYSASPFLRMLGTRIGEWRDGYARILLDVRPELLNRSGVVQGGVLATLLDHAAGLCGLWCSVPGNKRYGMTLSLTANYVGQAKAGVLVATGTRNQGGRSIYFSDAEVRTEGGVLLAKGTGVFRYRKGSEDVEGTPDLPWAKRDERG